MASPPRLPVPSSEQQQQQQIPLPIELLERIAEYIFRVEEWPAAEFTRAHLDQLRACYDMLELRADALAVLQRRVEHLSNACQSEPVIRRRLVLADPADDWERSTLFNGRAVRGPCCYLKLRCYDQQPNTGVPDYSDACYYATTGIMLVPAVPPIVQCLTLVNEKLRQTLSAITK